MHHPRRHLDQGADRCRHRDRHLRPQGDGGGRLAGRFRRHGRDRRGHLHGAPAAGDAALLSPRVVRPVHAVPRRHGLDAPDHRPHRRRQGPAGGHRRAGAHLQSERRHDDLRHGRRRGLSRRSASSPSTATSSSTTSPTADRSAAACSKSTRLSGSLPMPDFFINGQPAKAEKGQTVMQAAKAAGYYIPTSAGIRSFPSPATAASALSKSKAMAEATAGSRSPATCRSPKACVC